MDSAPHKNENADTGLGLADQNQSSRRSRSFASLAEVLIIIFICDAAIITGLHMTGISLTLEAILNPTLLVIAIMAVLYRIIIKPTNDKLETSEKSQSELDLFRNIIEKSNDSIFIVDPETAKILYANYRACITLGYKRHELLNMTLLDIGEQIADSCAWIKYIGKVRNFGYRLMEQYKRKDGTSFPVEVNASIAQLGRRDYMVAVVRDTIGREEARAALEERETRIRRLAESANDAIVIMGPKGEISFWNSAAERMFGYSVGEVTGKPLHTLLIPGRFREAHRKGFADFQKTGKGNVAGKTLTLAAIKKSGSEFSVELSITPAFLNGEWHAIGLVRDISKSDEADTDLVTAAQASADQPIQ
jgi:PAS domain S-box-containing protein